MTAELVGMRERSVGPAGGMCTDRTVEVAVPLDADPDVADDELTDELVVVVVVEVVVDDEALTGREELVFLKTAARGSS